MERYFWIYVTHLAWVVLRFRPVTVQPISYPYESMYACQSQCPPGYVCALIRTSMITFTAECSRLASAVDNPFAWQEELYNRNMLYPQQRHFGNGVVIQQFQPNYGVGTQPSNDAAFTQPSGQPDVVVIQQSGSNDVAANQQSVPNNTSATEPSSPNDYLASTRIGNAIRHTFSKIRRRVVPVSTGTSEPPAGINTGTAMSGINTDTSISGINTLGYEDPRCVSCEPFIGCVPGLYCYYSQECAKQICQPLIA